MSDFFTAEEERVIRKQEKEEGPSLCPRCGVLLDRTAVEPRTDVSYVRRRTILQCKRCQIRCVVDMK